MVSAVSFCHGRESSSHHTYRMQRGSECALSFSFLLVILSDPQLITGTVQYQGNSVSAITLTDTQKCTLVISSVLLNPIHSTDKIKRHRYQSGISGQIKKKMPSLSFQRDPFAWQNSGKYLLCSDRNEHIL